MIFSDTIIEKKKIFLRNLNINSQNDSPDTWSAASSAYGFYQIPYEIPLGLNKYYYTRFTYKFTTTNQSPTWATFYLRDGSQTGGGSINNPVAGTEYTVSTIASVVVGLSTTLEYGTIYNGKGDAIKGVSSQVKNVLIYDVTELYQILQQEGICSTINELKVWCDSNLICVPRYTNYDITELINNTLNKVIIKQGTLFMDELVEPDGMDFYAINNNVCKYKFFDTGSALEVYNNNNNGTVTHTRVDAKEQNSPFQNKHSYVLKITTNGSAAPSAGGFICTHTAAANKIFIEKFIAKVPIGYSIVATSNAQGSGYTRTFLTSTQGTGDWAEYAVLYKCGASGTFKTGGHIYVTGPDNTSVTWYVAYCISCDITNHEELKNFTILPNVERIKAGNLFTNELNTLNLFPNKKIEKYTLPTKWSLDYDDVIDGAEFSIVQDVNAGAYVFPEFISIVPGQRYKVSYWVKCKQDMTSFLTALYYINPSSTNGSSLAHANVHYISGTYVKLIETLNPGDTSMTVSSNANWTVRTCKLGFRSDQYRSYNNLGTSSSIAVSGKTGTTVINFSSAYSGAAVDAGKYVVEAYDGGTYPYPIIKSQLPTDNEWKYVEGYFGQNDSLWFGAVTSGSWQNIPSHVKQMKLQLNLYTNTGTVPIKYCNIKIEPIMAGSLVRNEQKIQIIGGN